ncbi:sushi domain-containing protein 1 [Rhinophrynus dorsalis]
MVFRAVFSKHKRRNSVLYSVSIRGGIQDCIQYAQEEEFKAVYITSHREVCKSCHVNATCMEIDSKYSCMCNFGLIGNGRTHCLDKDECQIGAHKICGDHTACHNTHGSFYCICLKGYRPSNKNDNFIPNDGTYCSDINECEVPDICGYNGLCKNVPGSYECSCMEGYRLTNGTEPVQANGDKSLCTDINECEVLDICGYNSRCKNVPGSFECYCMEGYRSRNGKEPFQAKGDKTLCTAVDCGLPPDIPNSHMGVIGKTTFGSQVTYRCAPGFIADAGHNMSTCTAKGTWEGPTLVCTDVHCGSPPSIPYTSSDIHINTTYGSMISYECLHGYVIDSGNQTAICNEDGQWTGADLICREIDCGHPPSFPNAEMIWNGVSNLGSEVQYKCLKGFDNLGSWNVSRCTLNETWENVTFTCTEVDCGRPLLIDHADVLWNKQSTLGSSVYYVCKPGFQENGGKNFSLCTAEKVWELLNLTCTVKEDLIGNMSIFNETCLRWKKSSEILDWDIIYKFSIFGTKWDQKDFIHKMAFNFTPDVDSEFQTVCLDLHSDTNYTVTMTAASSGLLVTQLNVTIQTHEKERFGNITVFNETCLQWTKSSDEVGFWEDYTVFIQGRILHPEELLQNIMFNFSSDKKTPVLCLELPPGAEYFVNVTELSTELSASVHLNISVDENENSSSTTLLDETCLRWNRSLNMDGEQEIYKINVQVGRWFPKDSLQDLLFNISTDQDSSAVCLELPVDTQHSVNVTDTNSSLASHLTTRQSEEPIRNLTVLNETCLGWRRPSGVKEIYIFLIQGIRWYQQDFIHRVIFNVTITEELPVVCLELHAGTNYSVHLIPTSHQQNPAQINLTTRIADIDGLEAAVPFLFSWKLTNRESEDLKSLVLSRYCRTASRLLGGKIPDSDDISAPDAEDPSCLGESMAPDMIVTPSQNPPLPKVLFIAARGQLPKVSFQRMEDKHAPISSYQIFVIHLVSLCSFTCESLASVTYFNNISKTLGYITAEFFPSDMSEDLEFSVGDRQYYGEFYNAPLVRNKDYCIILRIVSKWNEMQAQSCMVLAEIKGLPPLRHHMTEVLLGSVAFVCFILFLSYSTARCCKRR